MSKSFGQNRGSLAMTSAPQKQIKSMNMLTETEITAVQDIIIEQLGVKREQLTPDARLTEDLGADSLENVEIAMAVEDYFGISLPDDALERVNTVDDLYALLETTHGRISK